MIRSLSSAIAILGYWLAASPLLAADRPNFVIFMTDDQRQDAMSCAGNKILKTPNMDRLAAEGMRFHNMFVTNALCAPSRATILTGTYSHINGVTDNKGRRIREDLRIFPELLREAGYETAFCGKSHVEGNLRNYKWDYYFGFKGQGNYLKPVVAEGTDGKDIAYEGYMDDVVTDHALKWLEGRGDKPFCLLLWFKAPHRSWDRAPRHKDLFKDVTIPQPPTWDDRDKGCPGKPRAFAEATNRIGSFDDVKSLDYVKDYYATLTAVDENVGRVLKLLDEKKLVDNTAVFYTSDNGFFQGEWRAFDKRFMHEPSIRVPLLVRYPRAVKGGSSNDKMVLNLDIAPTVLDLAGVPASKAMQGRSMAPLMKGEPVEWRKDWLYTYFEFPGPHSVRENRGIRTERYKYIHYYKEPQEYELYDLEKDPGELNNLYGKPEYEDLVKKLRVRMDELRRELADPELASTPSR